MENLTKSDLFIIEDGLLRTICSMENTYNFTDKERDTLHRAEKTLKKVREELEKRS